MICSVISFCDGLCMYGDSTSRSKNSLPGTSHGKTSSSHGSGSGSGANPGTSHGLGKGAASRKGSPGGGDHMAGSSYGSSSYGNMLSGVDTSISSVSSSALGIQVSAAAAALVHARLFVRARTGEKQTAHREGPEAAAEHGRAHDHDGGRATCDV
jgi:hypothetical protein